MQLLDPVMPTLLLLGASVIEMILGEGYDERPDHHQGSKSLVRRISDTGPCKAGRFR